MEAPAWKHPACISTHPSDRSWYRRRPGSRACHRKSRRCRYCLLHARLWYWSLPSVRRPAPRTSAGDTGSLWFPQMSRSRTRNQHPQYAPCLALPFCPPYWMVLQFFSGTRQLHWCCQVRCLPNSREPAWWTNPTYSALVYTTDFSDPHNRHLVCSIDCTRHCCEHYHWPEFSAPTCCLCRAEPHCNIRETCF